MRDTDKKIKLEKLKNSESYKIVQFKRLISVQFRNGRVIFVGDFVNPKEAQELCDRYDVEVVPEK